MACRFLRLLVLYLYSCKMVVLGVLERLACEKRMMAKYFTYLLIGNYILLVKQNMETFSTNAVCFLGLTRFFSLLITSLILLEYDPEAFSRGWLCVFLVVFVCTRLYNGLLNSLVLNQKWKSYVSAVGKFLLSFHCVAEGRRGKKSGFKKMNIRLLWVFKKVLLVYVEISWNPGVWRKCVELNSWWGCGTLKETLLLNVGRIGGGHRGCLKSARAGLVGKMKAVNR